VEPVFRLVYLAHPKPSSPDYGVIDGAYASCWVKEPVIEAADTAAREFLEAEGWDIEELDEAYRVSDETCLPGAVGRDLFEQVQNDGIVVQLHTWPVGAPEEE
jgi:hypothetical protein